MSDRDRTVAPPDPVPFDAYPRWVRAGRYGETLLTSRGYAWPGCLLERYRLRPFEAPERTLPAHALALNLGGGVRLERSTAGAAPRLVHVASGALLARTAGQPERVALRDEMDVLVLYLDPQLVAHAGALRAAVLPPWVGPRGAFRDDALEALMEALGRELAFECGRAATGGGRVPPGEDEVVAALVERVAARLGRVGQAESGGRTEGAGGAPPWLADVLGHVEADLGGDLSLDALAAVAALSPHHFARVFKEATGHPPHGYVILRRMKQAERLLAGTALPVREVARQVGFGSPSHFTQAFRRHLGATPTAYRAERRRG